MSACALPDRRSSCSSDADESQNGQPRWPGNEFWEASLLSNYKPDAATQVEMFRRMALLKANDERARKMVTTGRLVMTYYSYRGQEVIPAAMSVNLTDQD